MPHLPQPIVNLAFWESREKGRYIEVLYLFGFVGCEKQKIYQQVKDFLWCHNIPFMSNTRGMIWLSTCDDVLMQTFTETEKES